MRARFKGPMGVGARPGEVMCEWTWGWAFLMDGQAVDRQRIRHECVQGSGGEKRKKTVSCLCHRAQPCSPAARASSCMVGWLARNSSRLALLGRACGNTCETVMIMAFCLTVGGSEVTAPFSCRAETLCRAIFSTSSRRSDNQPLSRQPSSSRVPTQPNKMSSQKIDARDVTHPFIIPPCCPSAPPPPADAVN